MRCISRVPAAALAALMAAGLVLAPAAPAAARPFAVDFRGQEASPDAERLADWVVASKDNQGLPFIIIDKVQAKVFVFNALGKLQGASRALMGVERGDDTVPGVGAQRLKTIRPDERITPAGRFVAHMGRDFQTDILWIDYDAALSLHRVVHGDPNDHRLRRLATDSARDKRISYGCVNVPAKFYDTVVLSAFTGKSGIVYIMPEVRRLEDVFHLSSPEAPDQGEQVRLGGYARAPASAY